MSKETLQEEIDELNKIKQSLQMDIIELDDKILFQDFGVYAPCRTHHLPVRIHEKHRVDHCVCDCR